MSADFSLFLHSLATEFDAQAGVKARDHLFRAVGRRIAERLPLPKCTTLEEFELETNALLALLGWGCAHIFVQSRSHSLRIEYAGLPTIGSLGSPPGYVLAPVICGLYERWLKQAEGSDIYKKEIEIVPPIEGSVIHCNTLTLNVYSRTD